MPPEEPNNQNNNQGQGEGRGEMGDQFQDSVDQILSSMDRMENSINNLVDSLAEAPRQLQETLFDRRFLRDLNDSLLEFQDNLEGLVDVSAVLEQFTSDVGGLSDKLTASVESSSIEAQAGEPEAPGRGSQGTLAGEFRKFMAGINVPMDRLLESFPEFLNDLALTEEAYQEIEMALIEGVSAIDHFQDLQTEQIERFREIQGSGSSAFSQIISRVEVLNSEFGKINDVSKLLALNLSENLGSNATESVIRLQDFIVRMEEKINEVSLDPTTPTFTDKFETLKEQAREFQNTLVNISATSLAGDESERRNQMEAMSETLNEVFVQYENIAGSGASVNEITKSIDKIIESQKENSSEYRENYEGFAEIQDDLLQNLKEQLIEAEEAQKIDEKRNEVYKNMRAVTEKIAEKFKLYRDRATAVYLILTDWRTALTAAGAGITMAAQAVYDYMFELDSATQELAQSTGMIPSELDKAQDIIIDIGPELMSRGMTLNEIADTVSTIFTEFGNASVAVERFGAEGATSQERMVDLADDIGDIATGLNISSEEAAGLLSTFQSITGSSGDVLDHQVATAKALADQADVAPKQVFQDIAQASEEIAKFGAVSGDEIARAAVEARAFGSSLDEVLQIAQGFRNDITGSIQGLQRAELMLGQNIDTARLLRASFEGPEASATALRETLGNLDLNLDGPLATFQLQSLSDAMGVSVGRLREMAESAEAAGQSISSNIQAGNIGNINDEFEASQTAIQDFQNTLRGTRAALLNLLAGPILNMVNPVLQDLSNFLGNLATELDNSKMTFEEVSTSIERVGERGGETQKRMAGLAATFVELVQVSLDIIQTLLPYVKSLADTFIFLWESGILKAVGALTAIGFAGSKAIGVFKSMTGAVKSAKGGITTFYAAFKKSDGIIDTFKNLSSTSSEMAESASKLGSKGASSVSKFSGSMGKMMKAINPASVFSIAAAIVALGGSVFLLSEAALNFAEVPSDAIYATIGALGALTVATAAIIGFGSAMTAAAPVVLATIGVLGSLSLTLYGLSLAAEQFASAAEAFVPFIQQVADPLVRLGEVGPQLVVAAGGIGAISLALSSLAGGGLLGAIGNFFGGSAIDNMLRLADRSDGLFQAGKGMMMIASALDAISSAGENAINVLDRLEGTDINVNPNVDVTPNVDVRPSVGQEDLINTANQQQGLETQAEEQGYREIILENNEQMIELLQQISNFNAELLNSMKSGEIAVYLDGKDVTDRLMRRSKVSSMRN